MILYSENNAEEIALEGTRIMRNINISFRSFGRRHRILSIYGKKRDTAAVGGLRPHCSIGL